MRNIHILLLPQTQLAICTPICTQFCHMINICPVKDSTSNDYRNLCSIFFFIRCFTCNDFPDFMIIIKSLQILQLIPGKSACPPVFWALDHK